MENEKIDLLEDFENLPKECIEVFNSFDLENMDYKECGRVVDKMALIGYHIDYDLSASFYDLYKI